MAVTKVKKIKSPKQKSKFSLATIWYFVRCLWSNQVVWELRTRIKWYWGIIVFVCTTIITVIPTMVTQFNVKGSDYVASALSDNFYQGLTEYAYDNAAADITFDEKFALETSNTSSGTYSDYFIDTVPVYRPTYSASKEGRNILDIYVINDKATETENIAWAAAYNNINGSNTTYGDADEAGRNAINENNEKYTRSASFIVFFPTKFFIHCETGTQLTTKSIRNLSGDYVHLGEFFGSIKKNGLTFKEILKYNSSSNPTASAKLTNTFENFSNYLNAIYINPGLSSAWVTILIVAGINAGMMLLMGLLFFLLTRGKKSVNRDVTIFEGFSMSFWLSLSPAILGMVMSFMMPAFSYMAFIMFFAMRAMFFTTKFLRPPVQQ